MAMKEKAPVQQDPNYKHIVRIANVDLPGNKPIALALTNIRGIGINFADVLCKMTKVQRQTKTGNLSTEEVLRINQLITKIMENPLSCNIPTWFINRRKDFDTGKNLHLFTSTLNFVQDNDLKRLKKIKSYRGLRHIAGQPVRGQRTRSNFRRNKGKVVGVAKKKAGAPAAAPEAKGKK